VISKWRWVAVAAVLAVAAAVGSLFIVSSHGNRGAATQPTPAPTRASVLAALPANAAEPTQDDVRRALAASLSSPAFGGHVIGEVVDAATGAVLFDRSADLALPPASTAKLLTSMAALSVLGPTATLTTDVTRAGNTLYLVGHGDLTLRAHARPSYPATADIGTLARRTAAALAAATPPPGQLKLCVDTTAWSGPARAPGWSVSYFNDGDIAPLSPLEVDEGVVRPGQNARVPDPAAQAAGIFAADLASAGVKVAPQPCRAASPVAAQHVASVSSPPVSALVQRMLTVSDNDLAEALGRAVAAKAGTSHDFAGEAAAVTKALARNGIPTSGVHLVDASGLSRLDRVPPQVLVDVLRAAMSPAEPQLSALLAGLPVAGFTGTLADRFRRAPASAGAGIARAKTGTLVGVNTLAGYVPDASGRLLVFAFMTDRAVSPDTAEPALDRLAAGLAGV